MILAPLQLIALIGAVVVFAWGFVWFTFWNNRANAAFRPDNPHFDVRPAPAVTTALSIVSWVIIIEVAIVLFLTWDWWWPWLVSFMRWIFCPT